MFFENNPFVVIRINDQISDQAVTGDLQYRAGAVIAR